jgi:hypothetical protein
MTMNQKIALRLKKLQGERENMWRFYTETFFDAYADVGMDYTKTYQYNEESIKMFNQLSSEAEKLEIERYEKLYGEIFNFTQTFFSFKEYLKKIYPQHFQIIEDFFSNEKREGIARKDICNDLKHNPENDLEYKRDYPETTILPNKKEYRFYNHKRWVYKKDIYSVEYCNILYNELLDFLKKNNF